MMKKAREEFRSGLPQELTGSVEVNDGMWTVDQWESRWLRGEQASGAASLPCHAMPP
jgi:hypothetical protein